MSLADILRTARKLEDTVFLPKIDTYLDSLNDEELADKESRRYDTGLHPSSISGCLRKAVFSKLGAEIITTPDRKPIRISPKLRRIFDNGHKLHDRMQGYFQDMGILLGSWECLGCDSVYPNRTFETDLKENQGKKYGDPDWVKYNKHRSYDIFKMLKEEPDCCPYCGSKNLKYGEVPIYIPSKNVEGRMDGLAYVGVDYRTDIERNDFSDFYILEFKSENTYKFKKHTSPHQTHVNQASIYSFGYGFKIDQIAVIYEDKNVQDMKEYIVRITEKEQEEVIRRIDLLNNCIMNKELPTEKMKSECTWCEHKIICDSDLTYVQIENRVKNIQMGNEEEDKSFEIGVDLAW